MFTLQTLSADDAQILHVTAAAQNSDAFPSESPPEAVGGWIICYKRFCEKRSYSPHSPRPIDTFLQYLSDRGDIPTPLLERAIASLVFYFTEIEAYPESIVRQIRRRWEESQGMRTGGEFTRIHKALEGLSHETTTLPAAA
jgi:hypothetical protein